MLGWVKVPMQEDVMQKNIESLSRHKQAMDFNDQGKYLGGNRRKTIGNIIETVFLFLN